MIDFAREPRNFFHLLSGFNLGVWFRSRSGVRESDIFFQGKLISF